MFGSFDSKDYMRHFDPTDFSVTFLGDEYPLIPVYKAVRELYEKAIVEANKW